MKNLKISVLGLLLISLIFTSCEKSFICIRGEGDVVEQKIDLPEFNSISNSFSGDVYISQGDAQEVIVVGHQNIIDRLKTKVIGNNWDIELKRACYKDFELEVYITVSDIEKIKINGSGNIELGGFNGLSNLDFNINGSGDIFVVDTIYAENLDIDINGSGNMDILSVCRLVSTDIMGSGDVVLAGSSLSQSLSISGSGQYQSFDMPCDDMDIKVCGSGNSRVFVNKNLDVQINGSGDVYYKGYPALNLDIDGSGSVLSWN